MLDGEGSTKLHTINVTGLSSEANCKKVAMKIANSPLVKTAAYGEDPNWGRIIELLEMQRLMNLRSKICP